MRLDIGRRGHSAPAAGLAHAAAVNLSDNLSDADRYAVYFRLWLDDIEDRRWHLMTHIWDSWRLPAEVQVGA